MVYASSKDALRRKLVGLAIEIQGTDYSEVKINRSMDDMVISKPTSFRLITTLSLKRPCAPTKFVIFQIERKKNSLV